MVLNANKYIRLLALELNAAVLHEAPLVFQAAADSATTKS